MQVPLSLTSPRLCPTTSSRRGLRLWGAGRCRARTARRWPRFWPGGARQAFFFTQLVVRVRWRLRPLLCHAGSHLVLLLPPGMATLLVNGVLRRVQVLKRYALFPALQVDLPEGWDPEPLHQREMFFLFFVIFCFRICNCFCYGWWTPRKNTKQNTPNTT